MSQAAILSGVGQKREHDQAFPHGSGTEGLQPDNKRQASSLNEVQKLFSKPRGTDAFGGSSRNLLKNILGNSGRGGGGSSSSGSSSTRSGSSMFSKVDARFLSFSGVLPCRPSYSGTPPKGYLNFTCVVPNNVATQIQVEPNIARMSPKDPSCLQMCKYFLKKDPNKKGKNGEEDKGKYVPMSNGTFVDYYVGQPVKLKKFSGSKPEFTSPNYAFQPFNVVQFSGIRTSDKDIKGNISADVGFSDVHIVANSREGCASLIDKVHDLLPPGTVYYTRLTGAPPAKDAVPDKALPAVDVSMFTVDTTVPPVVAGASGEASGSEPPQRPAPAPPVADTPTPTPTPVIQAGVGLAPAAVVDQSMFSAALKKGEGQEAAAGAEGAAAAVAGAKKKEEVNPEYYKYLSSMPANVQASHLNNVLFIEKNVPDMKAKRAVVFTEVVYDPTQWIKKYTLKNAAEEKYEADLPSFKVAVFGIQWDKALGTSPKNPERFMLRLEPTAHVAACIFGTGNNTTWAALAPGHLNVDLGTRFALGYKGELEQNYALQLETDFAIKQRNDNGVDLMLNYTALHPLFDLKSHLAMYAWPLSRQGAIKVLNSNYWDVKGKIIPANNFQAKYAAFSAESKKAQEHLKQYHPDVLCNMFESEEKVDVSPDPVKDDPDIYLLLTPTPLTPAVRTRLMEANIPTPSPEHPGEVVCDSVFVNFNSELGAMAGVAGKGADSILLYSMSYEVYKACRAKIEARRAEDDKLWQQLAEEAAQEGDEEDSDEEMSDAGSSSDDSGSEHADSTPSSPTSGA